ncbi:MAG: hypothetical protein M3437_16130 [Chloroflexota bacterium]|nr:hypothetical protein [Chloroflexota bacterium]MDQ5866659.1 hypothetical protein [Chloroflexota bacterium]
MTRLKQLGILVAITFLLVVALVGTVLGAHAQATPQPSRLVWAQVFDPAAAGYHLKSVFMTGPDEAWAVGGQYGKGGIIVHYQFLNGVWRSVSSKTYKATLNAVVAVSNTELWAVGDVETILRITTDGRNVVSIKEMGDAIPLPDDRPRADLTTIQMLGNGEEGWVGGHWTIPSVGAESYPMLLHYKQGTWEVANAVLGNGAIYDLHLTQGGGWMVGQRGIWRFEGGAWVQEPPLPACPDTTCYGTFFGVRAINAEEAWAVGSRSGICAICVSRPYVAHRINGRWERVLPDNPVANYNLPPQTNAFLSNVYFTDANSGLAVGHYRDNVNATAPEDIRRPLVFSYRSGLWSNETLPGHARGELLDVSMVESGQALAVGTDGLVLSYGYGSQPFPSPTPGLTAVATRQPRQYPTAQVPDPKDPNVTYFAAVGHTLRGAFRDYWQRHGGLSQFGYPLTEEYREVSPTDGKTYTVQWFERARFEHHPENAPPHDVLLGLLGHEVTQGRRQEQPFRPASQWDDGSVRYFPETRHNVLPQFLSYWEAHGGLPVYGYPISEPFEEVSATDGKLYTVQYFERNRFEWHPELPDPHKVSLGLLGVEIVYGRK